MLPELVAAEKWACEYFRVGTVTLEPPVGGTVTTNFRFSAKNQSVLVSVRPKCERGRVDVFGELVRLAASQGVPAVPMIPQPTRPTLFAHIVDGFVVSGQRWVVGETVVPSVESSFAAGKLLARVHKVNLYRTPKKESQWLRPVRVPPTIVPDYLAWVHARWNDLNLALSGSLNLARGLCHGDYFPDNLVSTVEGMTIVDWECANTDLFVLDLALGIVGWCQTVEKRLNLELYKTFLAGYETLRAVSPDEQRVLPSAVGGMAASVAWQRYQILEQDTKNGRITRARDPEALEFIIYPENRDVRTPCE